MDVFVVGFDNDQRQEIEDAVHFFGHILFHGNMLKRMTFTVQKNTDLELKGECWPEDNHCRMFVIDICAKCFDDDALDTLAHEMVHCKQWAKGELGVTSTLVARTDPSGVIQLAPTFVELWHGKVWKPKPGEDPYFDCPWEVEAYGRSVGMSARWKAKRDNQLKDHKNESTNTASSAHVDTGPVSEHWADFYSGA